MLNLKQLVRHCTLTRALPIPYCPRTQTPASAILSRFLHSIPDFATVNDNHKPGYAHGRGWQLTVDLPTSHDESATVKTLRTLFARFGKTNNIWVMKRLKTNSSGLGRAIVHMDVYEDACDAVNSLTEAKIEGTPLNVKFGNDRKRNIIVHRLAEEEDENISQKISTLLDTIGVQSDVSASAHRIGRNAGTRPVRLTLESSDAVSKVLKNKNLIKDSEEFSGVFITQDLSAEERKRRKVVISKLTKARRENPNMNHFMVNDMVVSISTDDKLQTTA